MLIVLEGLDGAGKSTQLKLATDYITSKGRKVEYLHFPRYSAPVFGDLIGKFLRGEFGSLEQVHPQLVALLFAEDRHDAAGMIRNWLNQGHVVILDRYVYSNIAFQCAKMKDRSGSDDLRDWIVDVEYSRYAIPKPDLNLFLDVPIEFVDSKLKNARDSEDREYLNGKADIHEADIAFQKNVRRLYLEQCDRDDGFKRIDCGDAEGHMLPAQDIFAKIKSEIDRLI